MTQLMQGKRGLIMGLANDKSIAWGIARALADAGAELALTYQGDQFRKRAHHQLRLLTLMIKALKRAGSGLGHALPLQKCHKMQ